ncbi:MAG TPA: hypothetical protein DCL16_10140 [Acidimicrobiaceae bacterium]|nr:hypothetical protein [Acidimicrobiaceae bacterium]
MCGRFVSTAGSTELETLFTAQPSEEYLAPSYNVAPSTNVYGVIGVPGSVNRKIEVFRWGFTSPVKGKGSGSTLLINARVETVDLKPRFAASFEYRRCLVPADGFFEWGGGSRRAGRQPSYIYKQDQTSMALAGIWEPSRADGGPQDRPSLVILTRESDGLMSGIHDRMPVTLHSSLWSRWLDTDRDNAGALKRSIAEAPIETLKAHYVDTQIGNPRRDQPENIAAVQVNTLW